MASDHNSIEIKVRVTEGSRMRAFQNNMFIMELSAPGITDAKEIELLQSEQYEITSLNPIIIDGLGSGSQRATFIIRPNIIGAITLNFKIGGKVKSYTISSQTENPYIYGEPIKNQHLFFGRVAELSEIHRGITKLNKQNYLITAPRRAGKTSLLYQLKARLNFPFISVMLTPEKMGHAHHQMFRSILLCIREEVKNSIGEEPPPLDWEVKTATEETSIDLFNYYFERDLKKFLSWLIDLSGEVRIILLLDEACFLLENSATGEITHDSRQEFLRHLLQSFDRIACVMAGTPNILRMTTITSPLYNIFSGVKLKGFTQEETELLIREPAQQINVNFDDDAVKKIIDYGGCSPYYTQALCSLSLDSAYEIVQKLGDFEESLTITEPYVDAAIIRILDMVEFGMQSLWDGLEQDEREMLVEMLSEPVIVVHNNRDVLARLIDMNLVNGELIDQNTPTSKMIARIKAKLDEQWISRQIGQAY